MQYSLDIKEHNRQAHTDIEHDIQKQQNGLFTFILRIDNGNCVDYNVIEYADARKYLILKKITLIELTVSPNLGNGSKPDPLRTDNSKRSA